MIVWHVVNPDGATIAIFSTFELAKIFAAKVKTDVKLVVRILGERGD